MDHLNYHASILFLTVMSLDRFLATVYLIETRIYRTRKNTIRVCALVWIISIAMAAPFFVFAQLDTNNEFSKCIVYFPGAIKMLTMDSEIEDQLKDLNDSYYDDYLPLYINNISDDERCYDILHSDSSSYYAYEVFNFIGFYIGPVVMIVVSYSAILHTASSRVRRIQQNQCEYNLKIYYKQLKST